MSAECSPKVGWLSGDAYCEVHGRDSGWPCSMSAETPTPCLHYSRPADKHGERGHCLAAGYYGNKYETPAPSAAEVEALAEVLGDVRVAGARMAKWWTNDEDHRLLIQVLRAECVEWARGALAAGYVSPARHAAEVQAARAEAYKDAANEVHIEARWQAEQGARQVSVSEGVWRSHFGDRLAVVERILRNRADGEAKA